MPTSPETILLPESLVLLKTLLLFTFMVHLVPVNLITGGPVFVLISTLARGKSADQRDLGKRIAEGVYNASFTAARLMVVSIAVILIFYWEYIPFAEFMTSNAVILFAFLLILGQTCIYYVRKGWDAPGRLHSGLVMLSVIIYASLGMLYSINLPIMLRPESWNSYVSGALSGYPDLGSPALYTGFLHFFLGTIAVSGLWIMIIGVRDKNVTSDWSKWSLQFGGKMFMHATFLNIVIGVGYIISLPIEDIKMFLGSNMAATHSLITSVLLTGTALIIIFKARNSGNNRRLVYTGSAIMLAVLFLMSFMRQQF